MLTRWQFNTLFVVGVGGAVFLLVAPTLGVDIATSPTAVTGIGAILTYVLTQRGHFTKDDDKKGRGRGDTS